MIDPACAYSFDLSALHTFGLRSYARSLRSIDSLNNLGELAGQWHAGVQPLVLGEGSNTAFISEKVDRPIWRMALKGRQYLGVNDGCYIFKVMAGENWHNFVEWTVANGLPGLENLALIPGSVGAAPVQNIGAYGVELADRIAGVHLFDLSAQKWVYLPKHDCGFAYRDSVFKSNLAGKAIITAVDFCLPVKWQPVLGYGDVDATFNRLGGQTASQLLDAIVDIRAKKLPDPTRLGNCGSFFKNPIVDSGFANKLSLQYPQMPQYPAEGGCVKLAAGWLIEQTGLKGYFHQGVGVYEKQALILINDGSGTARALRHVISTVTQAVYDRFRVKLEPEPNLI